MSGIGSISPIERAAIAPMRTLVPPRRVGLTDSLMEPVAQRLRMTPDELQAALQSGKSIEDLAAAKGISHSDLVDTVEQALLAKTPSRLRGVGLRDIAEEIVNERRMPKRR